MNCQSRESPFPQSEAPPAERKGLANACGTAALFLLGAGFLASLTVGPVPGWPSDSYRIAFLHWPALWASWAVYALMAALSVPILRGHRLAAAAANAVAPTGLMFAFLALWTGALWAKPLRGSWWAWDAPFATQVVLFLLYASLVILRDLAGDPRRADRACALLALAGAAGLPLPALALGGLPGLAAAVPAQLPEPSVRAAVALALVTAGFAAYAACIGVKRARCVLAEREWLAWSGRSRRERP